MNKFAKLRAQMIDYQMVSRGLSDQRVLDAVMAVPREKFVSEDLVEFAYSDSALPIEAEQTISQPYIVALMASALELRPTDRVLEVGTGSGYAAAVLAEIAREVYTIERHRVLVDVAERRLRALRYDNVHVLHGDGTKGWPEYAPFDAIVVAAGGPEVPSSLRHQLAIGGRMVIPVGKDLGNQKMLRIRRISEKEFREEDLGDVRFVPLIGTEGWLDEKAKTPSSRLEEMPLSELVYHYSEHFAYYEDASLDDLMDRIGDSRVVMLGEASHGTAEFYEMRARITKELIEKKGFNIIAVESDWTDAAWFDHFIHGTKPEHRGHEKPFNRFPAWMWANRSVMHFMRWLKDHNMATANADDRVNFYGLDLYSMFASIEAVLEYLEMVDPATAEVARLRYGCLMPWSNDPSMYGRVSLTGKYRDCEQEVITMLKELLKNRGRYVTMDGKRFFNAEQNARLIKNAEHYYRTIYYAETNSWNLRDEHMFETLQGIMHHHGKGAKAIIWAHNSHIGDARATSMSARGEWNIGQLVRQKYGDNAYLIGFGTDHGTVAAASEWGGPMEIKKVRPAHMDSYERVFHEVHTDNFLLPLRQALNPLITKKLLPERLERAIGVIYRPESELVSHYFYASLPAQFDEYIWFDETRAVEPLSQEIDTHVMDTFPFGV